MGTPEGLFFFRRRRLVLLSSRSHMASLKFYAVSVRHNRQLLSDPPPNTTYLHDIVANQRVFVSCRTFPKLRIQPSVPFPKNPELPLRCSVPESVVTYFPPAAISQKLVRRVQPCSITLRPLSILLISLRWFLPTLDMRLHRQFAATSTFLSSH